MKQINKRLGICALAIAGCLMATAQQTLSVPLSNPRQDGRLEVDIKYGPVTVTGTDRQDILITYDVLSDQSAGLEHVEGELHRLRGGIPEMTIEEADNVVTIQSRDWSVGIRLKIEVPRNLDVQLSSYNAGDLSLSSVQGTHNLETFNGTVTARAISGSLSANTFNGHIDCQFDALSRDQPMAFSNYTGGIALTLPESAQATLQVRSRRGEIYTDFKMEMELKAGARSEGHGQESVGQDHWVTGAINGGGVVLKIENHHGDVYVRK